MGSPSEDFMKTDSEIKTSVEAGLRSEPKVDASRIAVAVRDGGVVLTGMVRKYLQKIHAGRAARRIAGTRSMTNDIEVCLPYINKRLDREIVRNALEKLQFELPYSSQFIMVTVEDACLTLEGTLEWKFQRDRAEKIVSALCGVIGVSNLLVLKPATAASDIRIAIEDALRRSVERDAKQATVESAGIKMPRSGLRSWVSRTEADGIAGEGIHS
jgi:osmotically-inducible protein OsmY